MTFTSTFALNGKPLEDWGFILKDAQGWLSLPVRTLQTMRVIARDGLRVLSQGSISEPRTITLGLGTTPASLVDRLNQLDAFWLETLGGIEVTTVEDPTRLYLGHVTSGPVTRVGTRALATLPVDFSVTIVCYDALAYRATPTATSIPAANTDIALPLDTSSAPIRKLLTRHNGPFTSPLTMTMKNAAGQVRQTVTLANADFADTIECTASEWVDIDHDRYTITKYSAGVALDRIQCLDPASDFLRLLPQERPTLRVDKGTAVAYHTSTYFA